MLSARQQEATVDGQTRDPRPSTGLIVACSPFGEKDKDPALSRVSRLRSSYFPNGAAVETKTRPRDESRVLLLGTSYSLPARVPTAQSDARCGTRCLPEPVADASHGGDPL